MRYTSTVLWLYRINHAVGPLVGLYWRLGLDGETRRIPRQGPLLLASNHASFLDPWFLGMAFPRPVRYLITANWYYKSALWERFFRSFGTEPVRAGKPGATVDAVCRLLDRGEVVGLFPEGMISQDGRLRRFRSGLARIAEASGVPVLPVGIRGSYRSLPRQARVPKPTRVRVRVGRPARFAGDLESFTDAMREEIGRLSGAEMATIPPSSYSRSDSLPQSSTTLTR